MWLILLPQMHHRQIIYQEPADNLHQICASMRALGGQVESGHFPGELLLLVWEGVQCCPRLWSAQWKEMLLLLLQIRKIKSGRVRDGLCGMWVCHQELHLCWFRRGLAHALSEVRRWIQHGWRRYPEGYPSGGADAIVQEVRRRAEEEGRRGSKIQNLRKCGKQRGKKGRRNEGSEGNERRRGGRQGNLEFFKNQNSVPALDKLLPLDKRSGRRNPEPAPLQSLSDRRTETPPTHSPKEIDRVRARAPRTIIIVRALVQICLQLPQKNHPQQVPIDKWKPEEAQAQEALVSWYVYWEDDIENWQGKWGHSVRGVRVWGGYWSGLPEWWQGPQGELLPDVLRGRVQTRVSRIPHHKTDLVQI